MNTIYQDARQTEYMQGYGYGLVWCWLVWSHVVGAENSQPIRMTSSQLNQLVINWWVYWQDTMLATAIKRLRQQVGLSNYCSFIRTLRTFEE